MVISTKVFGLIGFPLSHSFSKKYFTEKFEKEQIQNCSYELYPIEKAENFLEIFKSNKNLFGLNVTIPHKQAVIPFLDKLDPASAGRIGAVNVIKKEKDGTLTGYNSDYYGFKKSLEEFLNHTSPQNALILGTGGAGKAVETALTDLSIQFTYVSRTAKNNSLCYEDLTEELIHKNTLIINASPVGTYPNTKDSPNIPYQYLTSNHFLYDLVYNPETTEFMKKGQEYGAKTTNGLQMLILQAEKAWEIWNNT